MHSCFPYCISTQKYDEGCESEALMCDSFDDECEYVIPLHEIVFKEKSPKKDSIAFSPLIGIFAMLITMPIQLAFEIYCIIVSRMKITDSDSCWMVILSTLMQLATVAAVAVILCYDA